MPQFFFSFSMKSSFKEHDKFNVKINTLNVGQSFAEAFVYLCARMCVCVLACKRIFLGNKMQHMNLLQTLPSAPLIQDTSILYLLHRKSIQIAMVVDAIAQREILFNEYSMQFRIDFSFNEQTLHAILPIMEDSTKGIC